MENLVQKETCDREDDDEDDGSSNILPGLKTKKHNLLRINPSGLWINNTSMMLSNISVIIHMSLLHPAVSRCVSPPLLAVL